MASTSASTFLLLFISLLLHLPAITPAASATDLELLLSFKSSLPNPDVLSSWQQSGNPCSSFFGVSCSGSRVVSLRLNFLHLRADFRLVHSYLLPINSLESLSLHYTNLTGFIPSAPYRSPCGGKLVEIDLSGNSLQGSVTDIPVLASSCSGLKSLNLSGNVLGFAPIGKDASPSAAPRLALEVLDLSSNKIAGDAALGWLLLAGAGLRKLYLTGNTISGEIPTIKDCSLLQYLDLSSNSLSGLGRGGAFSDCENLASLNLSSNHLAGEVPAELFGSCRSLVHLDMSSNNISGTLPSDFSSCSSLESINLSNNNFSGELPDQTLTSMTNLKELEFGYNDISGELMSSLSELSKLELLDLSSNALSGRIPPGLCQSPGLSLKKLYLQNNMLNGTIPSSIGNCSMLVSIDLSFNYLTGTLPSSLGSLYRLRDLIMWQNMLEGEIPGEIMYIRTLENLILDNNGLTGTIPDGLSNCTNLNWISLSSNQLTGRIPPWIGRLSNLAILKLGNNSFTGSIPPELGDCKSLIWLDLNSNQLNGTIPPTLSKQSGNIAVGLVKGKKYVYLRNDGSSQCRGAGNLLEFAGIRQEELSRVPTWRSCNFTRVYEGSTKYIFNNNGSMIFLDLSYNHLEGEIPKELGGIFYLQLLNLGHNDLSGLIPADLGRLKFIGILDLSHNSLEGPIPVFFSGLAMLTELDLSNNKLNGSIPDVGQLATFNVRSYENNSGLCGLPLPACGLNSSSSGIHHQSSRRSLFVSVAIGLLVAVFCIFAFIIFVECKKKHVKKKNDDDKSAIDACVDSWSRSRVVNSRWKITSTKEALSISLAAFDKPLRKLTFADLLEATNGFDDDALIGSGGFGDVYKAQLKDGSFVAIKKLIHVSGQGDKEFTAEMETIGKIKHRNLVPLLGYCKVGEERLLVYEYMKYGSLEDVLQNRRKARIKLNWAMRRKIAVGAARGIAFLHHSCTPHIIHRDMKSSNVLLDDELEARVADFGMARMMSAMDTHLSVSTLAGTPGYVPPEYYYQSFRCSTKGDVYSYGVVLLELLTGKQPIDSSDFGENNNLVGWVKQHSKFKISNVFDPELLKEDPGLELDLLEHLKIACACLDDRPLRRPTILQVLTMFKEIQAGSTVDYKVSASTASVDGSFGGDEFEGKEDKD